MFLFSFTSFVVLYFGFVAGQCPVVYALAANNNAQSQHQLCGSQDDGVDQARGLTRRTRAALGEESLDSHPNFSLLPQDCGFVNGDRIIGGTNAGLYNFPWMALVSHKLSNGIKFNCGGTIINNKYILTAAHCITGFEIAGVRVGEYDLRLADDCEEISGKLVCETNIQDLRVEEAIIHPDTDIGLLRLKKRIDFTPRNARPICLPVTSALRTRNITGADAVVTGWGLTSKTKSADILQAVTVPVVQCDSHAIENNGLKQDGWICAGAPGKDSCNGDSGGPLMVIGKHNEQLRYIEYGVVSSGPKNCGSGEPAYHTDVTRYMKWILDTIKA